MIYKLRKVWPFGQKFLFFNIWRIGTPPLSTGSSPKSITATKLNSLVLSIVCKKKHYQVESQASTRHLGSLDKLN